MTIRLTWKRIDIDDEYGKATFSLPLSIGCLPDNDLMIDSYGSGISRYHAHIQLDSGLPVLRDQQSTNGVYANRERVTQVPLFDGASFLLGNVLFMTEFLVQCRKDSCQKLVHSQKTLCPYCGQFLADAMTQVTTFL